MITRCRDHERRVREALGKPLSPTDLQALLRDHETWIGRLQHERLVHVLVMLFVCLFMLLSLGFTLIHPVLPGMIVSTLLLLLCAAYLIHYFKLENMVQRWYGITGRQGGPHARQGENPS